MFWHQFEAFCEMQFQFQTVFWQRCRVFFLSGWSFPASPTLCTEHIKPAGIAVTVSYRWWTEEGGAPKARCQVNDTWHISYDRRLDCLTCFLELLWKMHWPIDWLIKYSLNRCYLKLGDWQTALEGYSEKSIPQILQYYAAATDNDRNCYKAWHAWAYMNFETVFYYKSQQSSGADGANNGNICRTPPPVKTSSVSATCNYVFLFRTEIPF